MREIQFLKAEIDLKKINLITPAYVILATFINKIIMLPLVIYGNNLNSFVHTNHIDNTEKIIEFMLVVLIGPLLETVFFQKFIIDFLKRTSFLKDCYIIFISALLFGLNHYYSLIYILCTFFVGLVLAYTYVFYLKHKNKKTAFLVVFIIHLLQNLTTFILKY